MIVDCDKIISESERLRSYFIKCYDLKASDMREIIDLIESVSVCSGGTLEFKTINGQSIIGTGNIEIDTTADGTETKIIAGEDIEVTGTGASSNPYVIKNIAEKPDGSETKITGGENVSILGSGTISTPYVVNVNTPAFEQVNADWAATSGKAQILNKPTIPAAQVNSDWNAISGPAQILNKPNLSNTDLDYIASSLQGEVTSSNGSSAIIPIADETNAGLLSPGILSNINLSSDNIKKEIIIPLPANYSNQDFADIINSLDSFEVKANEILTFKSIRVINENLSYIYYVEMIDVGKGIYGSGGYELRPFELKVTSFVLTSNDLESDESTQVIDLGTNTGDILNSINTRIPNLLIQDQSEGYVFIKGTFNGEYKEYLWIGPGGIYGGELGAGQATEDDLTEITQTGSTLTATSTLSGTVRTDLTVTDPQVYLKQTSDSLLSLKTENSAGAIEGFNVTNNGNGTINVSSGTAFLRTINDPYSPLLKYTIPAVTNLSLTDNANNFVLVNYNGGSPALTVTTNTATINTETNSIAIVVSRVGNNLDYLSLVGQNVDSNAKLRIRFLNQEGIRRANGALIGFSARNLTLTPGVLFSGLIRINTPAFNTNTPDTFTQVYNNGIVWIRTTGQTQVNNTQYNNAGSLTNLSPGDFRTDYIYLLPNNPSKLYLVLGTASYPTITQARTALQPASLPVELQTLGVLVGRSIIQRLSANISEVSSSFDVVFPNSPVPEHNALAGLQGGAINDYQHLTTDEINNILHKTLNETKNGQLIVNTTGSVNALLGNSISGIAVSGESQIGTGVYGYSVNGTGVLASSSNGVGMSINNAISNTSDLLRISVNNVPKSIIDYLGNFSANSGTFLGNVISANPTASNHLVTKAYADGLVVGLLDDRGSYNASTNLFPTIGGSGTSGAVLKGDLWYVSVAGTLGGKAVSIGDSFRALVDSPGQTAANWSILSSNIGYVPENVANKQNSLTTDGTGIKFPTVDAVNAGFVRKSGNVTENITGVKSITFTDSDNSRFSFTNNATSFNSAAIEARSTNNGNAINVFSNLNGKGLVVDAIGNSEGIRTTASGTATSLVLNNVGTGFSLLSYNNTVLTASLNKLGEYTGTKYIKTGGLATEYLKADGSVSTLTNPITGTGASNQIAYFNGVSTQAGNANFVWDNGNGRLGLGTPSPTSKLHLIVPNEDGISVESANRGLIEIRKTGGARWRFQNDLNIVNGFELLYGNNVTPTVSVMAFSSVGNATINGGAGSDVLTLNKSTGASLSLSGATGATQSVKLIADNTTNPDFLLYTGGSEKMRVTSAGNVGIGTTNPQVKLEVRGQTIIGNTDVVIGSIGSLVQIDQGGTSGNTYSRIRAFSSGGTVSNNLILNGDGGNIGVGTNSPNARLDVNGVIASTVAGNPIFRLYSTDSNVNNRNWDLLSNVGNFGDFDIRVSSAQGLDPGLSVLKIKSSGNVGIGLTNPTGKLHTRLGNDTNMLMLYDASAATLATINDAGTVYTPMNIASNETNFFINGSNKMVIKSSGNVLLGTTTDNGVDKLQVNGTIVANGYNAINYNSGDLNSLYASQPNFSTVEVQGTNLSWAPTSNYLIIKSFKSDSGTSQGYQQAVEPQTNKLYQRSFYLSWGAWVEK